MRQIREILRLLLALQLSQRQAAKSVGVSPSTVSDYATRAKLAGLTWPLPDKLDDDALERMLFRDHEPAIKRRPEPDWTAIHQELLSGKHVTKLLVWQEFRQDQPEGLGYSQFCERYAEWARPLNATMRQVHRAGERAFVDFSGDGIAIHDAAGGEPRIAKLFVAVLGASTLTYVEPVLTEDLATWLGCHVRAFEYFEGVTELVVPDNLKAGVTRPDRYDPEVNPSYAEWARHYGVAVMPARVRRPRDKAKVEQAVLLAERWIIAVLRRQRFTSLAELRAAVAPLLKKLNDRKMRRLGKSRRELFEEVERKALRPLPVAGFEFADWTRQLVDYSYHVVVDEHAYSVPFKLVARMLDVRVTEHVVEVLWRNARVASHARSRVKGGATTLREHMPRSHQAHSAETPQSIADWAASVGPNTREMVKRIYESRPHPLMAFRSSLGLMRLRDDFPPERIERACARAVSARTYSRKSVLEILRRRLDAAEDSAQPDVAMPKHENIRGAGYYH